MASSRTRAAKLDSVNWASKRSSGNSSLRFTVIVDVRLSAIAKVLSNAGEGEITLLNAEPTVGSAPPWAGVTPAPSEKKSQNGEDAISLRGFFGERGAGNYLAQLGCCVPRNLLFASPDFVVGEVAPLARVRGSFYGRGGRRAQPPVGEGAGPRAHMRQVAAYFSGCDTMKITDTRTLPRILLCRRIRARRRALRSRDRSPIRGFSRPTRARLCGRELSA